MQRREGAASAACSGVRAARRRLCGGMGALYKVKGVWGPVGGSGGREGGRHGDSEQRRALRRAVA